MSSYPGNGYLFAPILGYATGGYYGTAITYDSSDPAPTDKPVKAADPLVRPYLSSGVGQWPGYGLAPLGLNAYFAVAMRNYPICCAIHSKIALPITASTRTYEVVEDGGDEDLAKAIQDAANKALLPMLNKAMPGSLESPFYGNNLQEMIWAKARDGKAKRTDLVGIRPVPYYQRIIHVNEYREYTGYLMFGQYADARYGFLTVHQPQIDDVLGWSPNSAALNDFFRSTKSAENADAIERKASGIQLLMYMMQGAQFVDGNGQPVDQQKFIQKMMNAAVTGESVLMPLMFFSKETIERNPELAKVKLMEHEVIDWGNLGPMIEAHTSRLRDLHTHICWAWGVSERSLMEADKGGMGTSDAEVHGDSNALMSETWHASICNQWDEQVTKRWMDANFRDSGVVLKAVPAPLTDPTQQFLQKVQLALLSNPSTAPEATAQIDIRKTMERTETPLLTPEDAAAKQEENEQKAKDAAAEKTKQMMQVKGQQQPEKTKGNQDGDGKGTPPD